MAYRPRSFIGSATSTEIQGQAARDVLAVAGLFGVAQGAPGVVEGELHGADQLLAKGQAAGQGAGQGAAGTVVAARQALAGKGMAGAGAGKQGGGDPPRGARAARGAQRG